MKVWKMTPVEELAPRMKVRFVAGDHKNNPETKIGELLPPEDIVDFQQVEGGFTIKTVVRHVYGNLGGPTVAEVFLPGGLEVMAYVEDPSITADFLSSLEPEGREPTPLDVARARLVEELTYRIWNEEQDDKYKTGNFKAELFDKEGGVVGVVYGMGFFLYVLIEGMDMIDLSSDEAGGAVPTDITNVVKIGEWEVY